MGKQHTTVAIVYDFDGTLAKGNIQENSFFPDLGVPKKNFWDEVGKISEENEMDPVLAYMYLLIFKAKQKKVKVDKNSLKEHGKNVRYFKGVEEYFVRINDYVKTKQVRLEHYIVSSGTKEMIEGTTIAKNFKYIYASSFKYDQDGVPEWPAIAINYTTKTQYLFRINKGIENAWEDFKINKFIPEAERPIPFKHMIYLGDGLTDVPAMKMVNYMGGVSIGVYDSDINDQKRKVESLLKEKRVRYIASADYSKGKEIDQILKVIIDKISGDTSIKKYSEISEGG